MLVRVLQHYGICKHKLSNLQQSIRPIIFILLLFYLFYDVFNRYQYAIKIELQDKNSLRKVFKYADKNNIHKVAIVSMEFDDKNSENADKKSTNFFTSSNNLKMSDKLSFKSINHNSTNSNILNNQYLSNKISKITNFNKKVYSKLHNYDYLFYDSRLSGFYRPVCSKIKALQHVMDEMDGDLNYYEYILWMDSDAQFLDLDISLEQVYEKIYNLTRSVPDVVVSCDSVGLNFGVAIFKNNDRTRELLKKTLEKWWYQFHWQQQALKVIYLSRYFFNTYIHNRFYYSWIAHTPNCQSECENYAETLTHANEAKFAARHNLTLPLEYVFEKFLQGKISISRLLGGRKKSIEYIGTGNKSADSNAGFWKVTIRDRFVKNKCSKNGF